MCACVEHFECIFIVYTQWICWQLSHFSIKDEWNIFIQLFNTNRAFLVLNALDLNGKHCLNLFFYFCERWHSFHFFKEDFFRSLYCSRIVRIFYLNYFFLLFSASVCYLPSLGLFLIFFLLSVSFQLFSFALVSVLFCQFYC